VGVSEALLDSDVREPQILGAHRERGMAAAEIGSAT